MTALGDDVRGLVAELGSAGRPDSIRGRLHVIENFNAAREAAQAALAAVQSAQAQSRAERRALLLTRINVAVSGAAVAASIVLHFAG